MTRFLTLVVSISLLAGGCFGGARHIKMTAPPKDAPMAERREAYHNLKLKPPEIRVRQAYKTGDSAGSPTGMAVFSQRWYLGDERRITHIPDLGQVVDEDSETAKHIDSYVHAHEPYTYLKWVSLGLAVAGLGLVTYGISEESWMPGVAGGLSVVASPIVILSGSFATSIQRHKHAASIQRSYNADLRDFLAVELAKEFRERQRELETGSAPGTGGFRDTSKDVK